MKCSRCCCQIDDLIPNHRMLSWHKLFTYFQHELTEGEITNQTWEDMTDALSDLRPDEAEVVPPRA